MRADLPSLHAGPAVGFDQAFEMLSACHDRVRQRLRLLARLAEHLQQQGSDAQAQAAASDVLRYFELAAPHHHEDEERHVLPRLRQLGHSALAERLSQEHTRMLAGWQPLRAELLRVQAGEHLALDPSWRDWAELYGQHIDCEDAEAFAAARADLDAATLAQMGAEMAARRRA